MGRQKAFSREKLLSKTLELFREKGYADSSLRDIQEVTGLNKSSIYAEFQDKEDLFRCSLRHYLHQWDIVNPLMKEPLGWNNIVDFLTGGAACESGKGCFVANSIRELQVLPQSSAQLVRRHMTRSRLQIQKNLEAAGLKENSKDIAAVVQTFSVGMAIEKNLGQRRDLQRQVEIFLGSIQGSLTKAWPLQKWFSS